VPETLYGESTEAPPQLGLLLADDVRAETAFIRNRLRSWQTFSGMFSTMATGRQWY
jgi:hypothetical protein